MTGSRCARRSWTPGERCAGATAIATTRGSTVAPSWPDRLKPSPAHGHPVQDAKPDRRRRHWDGISDLDRRGDHLGYPVACVSESEILPARLSLFGGSAI